GHAGADRFPAAPGRTARWPVRRRAAPPVDRPTGYPGPTPHRPASRPAAAASDERGSGLTSPLAGHLTQHGGQLARLAEQQPAARVVIEGDVPGAHLYRIDSCSLRPGPQARIVTAAAHQVEIERAAGGLQPLHLLRAGRALR